MKYCIQRPGLGLYHLMIMLLTLVAFASHSAPWPRQITDSKGVHTLTSRPLRIVSTSVTLTGSLLAIDAPVIASGTTRPANKVADAHGFLRQWGNIAVERQVFPIPAGEPNPELIAARHPDLILVSATGGDSALAAYEKLSAIAPTLVINYDDKSWQQLLTQLGEITGREAQAAARISQFASQLAKVKGTIVLPPQPVTAMVWNPQSSEANIWTPVSAQGQLLQQIGFTLTVPTIAERAANAMGKRRDIIPLAGENLITGLTGKSFLLFSSGEADVRSLLDNPLLAHLDAVRDKHVWAMGDDTFRLDYYSASHLLETLAIQFKQ